jgi:hypothetical protein
VKCIYLPNIRSYWDICFFYFWLQLYHHLNVVPPVIRVSDGSYIYLKFIKVEKWLKWYLKIQFSTDCIFQSIKCKVVKLSKGILKEKCWNNRVTEISMLWSNPKSSWLMLPLILLM